MIKITKNNILLLLSIVFTLVCVSGCCGLKKECLTIRGGEMVTYKCENGDRIGVKYYSLSDGSLNLVKVILSDGKEQTLPQTLSASGCATRMTGNWYGGSKVIRRGLRLVTETEIGG